MKAKHLFMAVLALGFMVMSACAPSGDPNDDDTESPRSMSMQGYDHDQVDMDMDQDQYSEQAQDY